MNPLVSQVAAIAVGTMAVVTIVGVAVQPNFLAQFSAETPATISDISGGEQIQDISGGSIAMRANKESVTRGTTFRVWLDVDLPAFQDSKTAFFFDSSILELIQIIPGDRATFKTDPRSYSQINASGYVLTKTTANGNSSHQGKTLEVVFRARGTSSAAFTQVTTKPSTPSDPNGYEFITSTGERVVPIDVVDFVPIRISSTTGANIAPLVDAGPDQTITLSQTAIIDATVEDDGLPDPPAQFTHQWSVISAPGTINISDLAAVDITATVDTLGDYILELSANDSLETNSDYVTIHVVPDVVEEPAAISFSVDNATPEVTHNVMLTVNGEKLPTINEAKILVRFDNARLEYQSQLAGSIAVFQPDGRSASAINQSGEVRFGINNPGGFSGESGSFGNIVFKTLIEGETTLTTQSATQNPSNGTRLVPEAELDLSGAVAVVNVQGPQGPPNVEFIGPLLYEGHRGDTITHDYQIRTTNLEPDPRPFSHIFTLLQGVLENPIFSDL